MHEQADEQYAVVSVGRDRVMLQPGESVTFGRGVDVDVRIGHTPADLRVSRAAGRLECRHDGVLIYNTSEKRTLYAETFPGPGFEILPQSLAGTAPHPLVTLVIHGQEGARHTLHIDASRLVQARPPTPAILLAQERTVGYERLEWLTDRQRQVLLLLSLPGRLGWNGSNATPTYADMERIAAERGLRLSAKTIRNTLDDLRRRVALEHGIYNIHSDGPSDEPVAPISYLPAFALWARLSGNVSDAELEEFDARSS